MNGEQSAKSVEDENVELKNKIMKLQEEKAEMATKLLAKTEENCELKLKMKEMEAEFGKLEETVKGSKEKPLPAANKQQLPPTKPIKRVGPKPVTNLRARQNR